MHIKELIVNILKPLAIDMRKAMVGIGLVAAIGAVGGPLYLSKTALDYSTQLLQKPTPLWITIGVVLLLGVYTWRKNHKPNSPSVALLRPACGVLWDAELNMRCLSCRNLLKNSSFGPSTFFCSDPRCNSKHILKDNDGNELTNQ